MSAILRLRLEGTPVEVDLSKCDGKMLRLYAGILYGDIATIEGDLKANAGKPGTTLDWEERAQRALHIRRNQVAAIEKEQSRRQERAERLTTEHQFAAIARATLSPKVFAQLWQQAEDKARAERLGWKGAPRG